MAGHIKLGDKLAQRDYILEDPRRYRKTLANQMAAKIGQGAGEYTDFQNWSYWVQDSWRSGVGRIDPDDGGFYFSTSDTRYNSRVMLPPIVTPTGRKSVDDSDANFNTPGSVSHTLDVDGTTHDKVAIPYQADGTVTELWVMVQVGYGEPEPDCYVYSGASEPTTQVATGTLSQITQAKGYEWVRVSVDSHTASSGTQYWLVMDAVTGDSFTLPLSNQTAGTGGLMTYADSTWSNYTVGGESLYGFVMAPVPGMGSMTAAVEFNSTIYAGDSSGDLWKWDSANDVWTQVGTTLDAGVTDMERWMGSLWVAVGPDDNAYKVTTGDVVTQQSWAAQYFAVGFGYLWRSLNNGVYYDNADDLSSWSTEVVVGSSDYTIRGLAPLEDDMYVSTDQALWRIGAGDYVYGVGLWGYYDATNGKGMINHQGSIYAPQGNVVWRVNANTPMLNIWSREEPLPSSMAGTVVAMAGSNRELFALIHPSEAQGSPSLWSWNAEGWHFVAQLPPGTGAGTLVYDANTECVWVFDRTGHAWNVRVPLNIPTPQQDGSARFMPTSWMETGIFYGNLKEITKDFDSVTVLGENISTANNVEIWYRTQESTLSSLVDEGGTVIETEDGDTLAIEVNAWSYLGKITESGQRLRWTDYDVRPQSKDLSVAIKLVSTDEDVTPVVRAIVVRYHPVIADRWRWRLPIVVSAGQQMLDGSVNDYTYTQQTAHLDTMAKRIQPIIYTDIDGVDYEVKVVVASSTVLKYEWINGKPDIQSLYDVTLEQVTDEVYSG